MLLTSCTYVNILFLIPVSLFLLSLFSSLSEIKCILKCCEVSTMISSSDHPLGGLCACVREFSNKDWKGKNIFQCCFGASSPLSAPWSQLVLCPFFSFTLGLILLWFKLVLHQHEEADFGVFTLLSAYLPFIHGCGKISAHKKGVD